MDEDTSGIARICRFCLHHDGLMALSTVIGSAFTFEDVVYYTGIQISETEEVPVCNECCVTINKSANFRRTCLSNDIIFKKITSLVKVSVSAVDSSIVVESDSQNSTEDNNFEEAARNDTGIVTLDGPDSDDSSVQEETIQEDMTDIIESQLNDRMEKSSFDKSRQEQVMSEVDGKKENENAADSKRKKIGTLHDVGDLLSSSSGVKVRVALKDKTTLNLSAPELKVIPNDTLRDRTMIAVRPYAWRSLNTPVDSDSDDSVLSLYSEVMAKADEELLEARRTELLKAKRLAIEAVDSMQSPGGASAEARKENPTDPTSANLKTPDDADSDDSVISLYTAQDSNRMKPKPVKLEELCPYCGVLTRDWMNHVNRTHIKDRRYPCPRCPKKYTEKYYLKEHMNTVHEKRIILTCELCGKGFINSNSHFYHMTNAHRKSDVYECDICHRKLRSFDGYRKHLKIHSLTSLPCPHCNKFFKTTETLETHHLRYHASKTLG